MNRFVVYSISRPGASELVGRREYYFGSTDIGKESNGHVQHALELNDIHLALKQSRTLVRWTLESDNRSRNEFTGIGYVKDLTRFSVRVGGQECRFALEYERTPKSRFRYTVIRSRIEAETSVPHFLYLAPNYVLLLFLVRRFAICRRAVYFGLRKDFLTHALGLSVRSNRSPISTTLRAVLAATPPNPSGRNTAVA